MMLLNEEAQHDQWRDIEKKSGMEEKLTTQNWKDRIIKHLLYPKAGHLGLPFLFPAFSWS